MERVGTACSTGANFFLKGAKRNIAGIMDHVARNLMSYGLCQYCPGVELLTDTLGQLFENNFIENITFNAWNSTDRTSLNTFCDTTETFLEKLAFNLVNLLKHDFIAQKQSKFLKNAKESLQADVFIVLLDFSQNCGTIIQVIIQS